MKDIIIILALILIGSTSKAQFGGRWTIQEDTCIVESCGDTTVMFVHSVEKKSLAKVLVVKSKVIQSIPFRGLFYTAHDWSYMVFTSYPAIYSRKCSRCQKSEGHRDESEVQTIKRSIGQ